MHTLNSLYNKDKDTHSTTHQYPATAAMYCVARHLVPRSEHMHCITSYLLGLA